MYLDTGSKWAETCHGRRTSNPSTALTLRGPLVPSRIELPLTLTLAT